MTTIEEYEPNKSLIRVCLGLNLLEYVNGVMSHYDVMSGMFVYVMTRDMGIEESL